MRATISRLLAAVLITGAGFAPAPTATTADGELLLADHEDPDPFPFGACLTVKPLDPDPLCVVVDPEDA